MPTGRVRPEIGDSEAVKAEWPSRLSSLVDKVEAWTRA